MRQASSCQARPHSESPRSRLFQLPLLTGLMFSLTLGLSACGSDEPLSQNSAVVSLPTLDSAEEIRDQIARSESAISESSRIASTLATNCTECQQLFEAVSSDADQRLELSGGIWNPWPEAQSDDLKDLPTPAAIGQAPITPTGIVGYMRATAKKQLSALADTTALSSDETLTLGSLLAGRVSSAHSIASKYSVDEAKAQAEASEFALQTSVGEIPQLESATSSPTTESQSGDDNQSGGSTADSALTSILTSYDCLTTAFSSSELSRQSPDLTSALYDKLVQRQSELVHLGTPDERGLRCNLQTNSTESLFSELLGTDLNLLASASVEYRNLGAQYLWEDLQTGISVSSIATVHVGTIENGGENSGSSTEEPNE